MNFGKWDSIIHDSHEQVKRICAAQKISSSKINLSSDFSNIIVHGSGSEPYVATLNDCTCSDFSFRRLPCKHIYRLAIEIGAISDLPQYNKKAAASFDVEAEIARYYAAYKSGAITGDKFVKIADAIKKG
jgi:predicted nucleic acid-binding Zn finger protein